MGKYVITVTNKITGKVNTVKLAFRPYADYYCNMVNACGTSHAEIVAFEHI